MRLFLDSNASLSAAGDCLVVIRHGQDGSLLTTALDEPLISETIEDVNILSRETADWFKSWSLFSGVELFYSPKLRVAATADLIAASLTQNGIAVNHNIVSEVKELYQGSFVIKKEFITDGIYFPLLKSWEAFQEELRLGNLFYRFGDPLLQADGTFKYPQLIGWFNRYGENQREFSLRLYYFLESLFSKPTNRLRIIVSHQAILSRIQRLISVCNKLVDYQTIKAGEFVTNLERTGDRLTIDYAQGVVISGINTKLVLNVVKRELDYLRELTT